jgi:transcriptional regulator with XRE-family HTH domain
MRTRIREFRKMRAMTLKELAERIGTTPQTVQRLETDNMTVSTDWLEKIAQALQVEPADLLGGASSRQIPLLGRIGQQGYLHSAPADQSSFVHLEAPAESPVAARLDVAVGPFTAGTVLVANRLREADLANAHGMDCIAALESGPILLCRVIRGRNATWTLVPHDNGSDVRYDQNVLWLARLIMAIKYL